MSFKIPNISIDGGPTVDWNFTDDVAHAECGGAKAYAEMRNDGCADLTIKTATGDIIADVIVRKMPADESITVSVMNVGTALLWSHARWAQHVAGTATIAQPALGSATMTVGTGTAKDMPPGLAEEMASPAERAGVLPPTA